MDDPAAGYAIFDTRLDRCAIVWRGGFVIGFALPEGTDEALRHSVRRRFQGAEESQPPRFVQEAMDQVRTLLSGGSVTFHNVPLGLAGLSVFERAVLAACSAIPPGEKRTYGELAEEIGSPGAARAVGTALGRNPIPLIIPCHRVVGSAGKCGGFSAPGGASTKVALLNIEQEAAGTRRGLFEHLPLQVKGG